ncbi:MAG: HD domain-containing protein [Clostridia bacterium]|jgi:(p)ppGpp synthase/HD superfamily hydrolase|nr:HD domain-containing protein [Clostridia bacterium]
MNRIERAIYFATKAHSGQKKKSENIDVIIHPYSVAMELKKFGAEEDIVIAGLLHDTIEDTKITYGDIVKEFGERVANIVREASEEDKSKSWENRKMHTIEFSKVISEESKLVVAADKINNLSWVLKDYEKHGEDVWSFTKRGKEKQKWYYESLLESLRFNSEDNELYKKYEALNKRLFE